MELDAAYHRVAHAGQFVLGQELASFEEEFARYCDTTWCIGAGNGLDALKIALLALGVGAGDEVIVPGNTFIATFFAVSALGAVVVPVDPRPDTFTIDAGSVAEALTDRTKAVVPVHLFGHPAGMGSILELAEAHRIAVLEDAAQAHGAMYRGRRVGGLGTAAAFSFYPSKNLPALGDAGAVTTSDPELAARVRALRNYGSTTQHVHEVVGTNSRLDELQAAFLRVGLRDLERLNAIRARIAQRYSTALKDCEPVIRLPLSLTDTAPVWHQYVIVCDERDALRNMLAQRGITTAVHYPVPPHLQPAFEGPGAARLRFRPLPITERLANCSLSLPAHPYLSDDDQDEVIAAVRAFCESRRSGGAQRAETPEADRPADIDERRRRIVLYEHAYLADYGFESVLVTARQRMVTEVVGRHRPVVAVEIGCGADMLYRTLVRCGLRVGRWVVVEPAPRFVAEARRLASEHDEVRVVEGFFEDVADQVLEAAGGPADLVVVAGLLHELEHPAAMLAAVRSVVAPGGVIHVNVQNAFSLHRRVAQAAGLIDDVHELSARNRALHQPRVMDRASLRDELAAAGFVPEEEGGYLLKPFTNDQMATVTSLLAPEIMDGLWELGRQLPDLACEIYVNARLPR
jgi:dTDP-3-amino-3,4,6-trideoxy-alpha-D-glucose transaminase